MPARMKEDVLERNKGPRPQPRAGPTGQPCKPASLGWDPQQRGSQAEQRQDFMYQERFPAEAQGAEWRKEGESWSLQVTCGQAKGGQAFLCQGQGMRMGVPTSSTLP